jgi:ribonucleoside-diphosphate reductase alpha chain
MIDAVASEHASVVARETDAVSSPEEDQGDVVTKTQGLNQSTAMLMGDAPPCDVCGSITVRNGTCYKCMNCGNSMGCS